MPHYLFFSGVKTVVGTIAQFNDQSVVSLMDSNLAFVRA